MGYAVTLWLHLVTKLRFGVTRTFPLAKMEIFGAGRACVEDTSFQSNTDCQLRSARGFRVMIESSEEVSSDLNLAEAGMGT